MEPHWFPPNKETDLQNDLTQPKLAVIKLLTILGTYKRHELFKTQHDRTFMSSNDSFKTIQTAKY